MLEGQLAEIDLRRSVIENLLSGMPHDPEHCDGSRDRLELEAEMAHLWLARVEIARRLAPASGRQDAGTRRAYRRHLDRTCAATSRVTAAKAILP